MKGMKVCCIIEMEEYMKDNLVMTIRGLKVG